MLDTGIMRSDHVGKAMDGKWFAEVEEHAVRWGEKLHGSGNFGVIEARFPAAIADKFHRDPFLDGIGPARFAEAEDLPYAQWRVIRR